MDLFSKLGLSPEPGLAEYERLSSQERALLVREVAGDVDAASEPLLRLVALVEPSALHGQLSLLDPGGPAREAFDRAPWDEIKHWAEELTQYRHGLPSLDEGRPGDSLAAALTVLGRQAGPRALSAIEGWLGEATDAQVEAAQEVLGEVGLGLAGGGRTVLVWPLPALRLVDGDAYGVSLSPEQAGPECARCGEPAAVAGTLAKELLGDFAVRGDTLSLVTCPRCLAQGAVVYARLGWEPAIAEVLVRGPQGDRPPLRLPEGPQPKGVQAAPRYDDPGRPERHALSRIGGVPTFLEERIAVRSLDSGEPMLFVGQLYLPAEEALLYAFYCSEEALLATCVQHYEGPAPAG